MLVVFVLGEMIMKLKNVCSKTEIYESTQPDYQPQKVYPLLNV